TKHGTAIGPQFISAASFADDRAPVRKDGNLWGYIDRSGALVIPAKYDEARPFSEGRAAVQVGGRWGFIDTEGRLIVEPQFDEVWPFRDGAARVRLNVGERQTIGYVDRNGRYLWYPTD
ncbi:MAG: WG repeat-containing protein, partial [Bacteroidetes bacterium]